MSFVLNGTTLPDPQSFEENFEVIGDISRTMLGSARRAVRARKRVWTMNWEILTQAQFQTIKTIYELNTAVTLVNSDLQDSINTTVLTDIPSHVYIAGTGQNYISGLELVLTEV